LGRVFLCLERYTARRIVEVIPEMSTLSLQEAELPAAVDDFSALEERVVRAVELVKA
jgi:hypothetical protein